MSWNDYVAYLRQNNVCEKAAIISADDASIWATDNFTLSTYSFEMEDDNEKKTSYTVNESALVLAAMKEGKLDPKVTPYGLRMAGVKWQIVMFDKDSNIMYLKKEKGGGCLVKTAKTIIFGSFDSTQQILGKKEQNPGDCNKAVESLAKMLKDAGYWVENYVYNVCLSWIMRVLERFIYFYLWMSG